MVLDRNDAQDFLEGGFAVQHAADAGVPERGHAAVARDFLEFAGRQFVEDEGAHGVVDDHDFAEGSASGEAGMAAGGAAGAMAEDGAIEGAGGQVAEEGGVGSWVRSRWCSSCG